MAAICLRRYLRFVVAILRQRQRLCRLPAAAARMLRHERTHAYGAMVIDAA